MSRLKDFWRGKPSAVPKPSDEVAPVERMAVLADQLQALADEMSAQIEAELKRRTKTAKGTQG